MKLISNKKNISFGIILTYISLAISIIASFFVTPIILNGVGDSNYGLFSFCNSITSWLAILSTALGSSYLYFLNKEIRENKTECTTNSIFFYLLLFLSAFVAATTIIGVLLVKKSGFTFQKYTIQENNLIFSLLIISGINVAITIFFSSFNLFNNYKKEFIFTRSVSIIFTLIAHALNIFFVLQFHSIYVVAIMSVLSSLLTGIANLIFAVKFRKMAFKKSPVFERKDDIKAILKYSSIILLGTIFSNLDANIDKTLLGIMVDAQSVAIYQLSISFSVHLVTIAYSFSEVLAPTIYEYYRNGREDKVNDLFLIVCRIQSIVILFIIGGYISCGYHFVQLWIGIERIAVYFYSSVLFLSLICQLTRTASVICVRAKFKQKIPTLLSFLSTIINLTITAFLLTFLDKTLAVWACIIGTICPRIVLTFFVRPIYDNKSIGLPLKNYYWILFVHSLFMIVSIIPSMVVALYIDSLSFSLIYKIIIEGFAFVLVYIILVILYERKFVFASMRMLRH